jgi:hypothetical protein
MCDEHYRLSPRFIQRSALCLRRRAGHWRRCCGRRVLDGRQRVAASTIMSRPITSIRQASLNSKYGPGVLDILSSSKPSTRWTTIHQSAALARFLKRRLYGGPEEAEEERRLDAQACVYSQITTAHQATFDVRYGFENGTNATDVGESSAILTTNDTA